jgi:alkanesulfonate monooxygenase SsuD/methylene tetrahydromethanopterin reductase-like flavin-dependent oxidoreductase (luciferase family)
MDIAIGLNATIPGATRSDLLEWARRAESRGFSALSTIDRIVYPNYEPLIALTAAAAVTERIRLLTTILLGPLRSNNALFAKQAATLDQISGGRLELGIGLGGREDDYEVSGVDYKRRGALLDTQVEELKRLWAGEKVGIHGGVGPKPFTEGGPKLFFGAGTPPAFRRAARHGTGWVGGGGGVDAFSQGAEQARQAWADAGRSDPPRLGALAYYSLGPEAGKMADWYLDDYYGFLGEIADYIRAGAHTDTDALRTAIAAYEEAGCEELVLFPCAADPEQVDLLAEAVL